MANVETIPRLTKASDYTYVEGSIHWCIKRERRQFEQSHRKGQAVAGGRPVGVFTDAGRISTTRARWRSRRGLAVSRRPDRLGGGPHQQTWTFYRLPRQNHEHLNSINRLERLNEKIRRRTRVVRIFPSRASCRRLIRALAVKTHGNWLEANRY